MSKGQLNLQDSFLNQVRKENVLVTLYLINGFQLKGIVRGFDNFTVIMESDGKQMLVYKHAISTITPMRPITYGVALTEQHGAN
ncbi:MAG TPA: RNA chaperone Hfq [Firmicutes bacterium]|jgi:host factor-I protein|nr:RNA chaperone Hfq [Bacillota bacterium]